MRLEFIEGTSRKFWEAVVEGPALHLRWGRLGTAGQTKTHVRESEAAARLEQEKLVERKLREGYVRAAGDAAAVPVPVQTVQPAPMAKPVAKLSPADARAAAAALAPTATSPGGVATWSLYRQTGGAREFFELSAAGGALEIARGKVGRNERVREITLAAGESPGERVRRELAKALAEGFAPGTETAPIPDFVDEEGKLRATGAAWFRRHDKAAFVPEVRDGEGALAASRFGGAPALRTDEEAPRCGHCSRPLTLIAQLDHRSLPAAARKVVPAGLVQLLWCDTVCQADDGWEPSSTTHLARSLPLSPAVPLRPRRADEAPEKSYPPKEIVSWSAMATYPSYPDQRKLREGGPANLDQALEALVDDETFANLGGERLLGWPHWIQDAVIVKCRDCGAPMTMFLQVDTNRTLKGIGFGDAGISFLFACAPCVTFAFVWQSC